VNGPRLLAGQLRELAVGVLAQLRSLSHDGEPRSYQGRLPGGRYLTVTDVPAGGGRALLFLAPRPHGTTTRVVTARLARPAGAPLEGPWFTGLDPVAHRAAVDAIARAIRSADVDYASLPGATAFDPMAPLPAGAPPASAADEALDLMAVQEAWALDAPRGRRDPALVAVVVAGVALALAMLVALLGAWMREISTDAAGAAALMAMLLGVVAGVSSLVAAAVGPEPGGGRGGAVLFSLLGGVTALPACLPLLSDAATAGSLVCWMLAAVMFLIAWGQATGAYGVWWLAPVLPVLGGAVGAPVGAVVDATAAPWGYTVGIAVLLVTTAIPTLTLLRSPSLIAHRRVALAAFRRQGADGAPAGVGGPGATVVEHPR